MVAAARAAKAIRDQADAMQVQDIIRATTELKAVDAKVLVLHKAITELKAADAKVLVLHKAIPELHRTTTNHRNSSNLISKVLTLEIAVTTQLMQPLARELLQLAKH